MICCSMSVRMGILDASVREDEGTDCEDGESDNDGKYR